MFQSYVGHNIVAGDPCNDDDDDDDDDNDDDKKTLKYKSLCIDIQRMWNLKCMIIPVIIGATGIVTRSLRKNLEACTTKNIR